MYQAILTGSLFLLLAFAIDGAMTIIVLISSLMVAAARFTAPRTPTP